MNTETFGITHELESTLAEAIWACVAKSIKVRVPIPMIGHPDIEIEMP